MSLHADAVRVVTEYWTPDPRRQAVRAELLAELADPHTVREDRAAGHVTAGALITDPTRRAVLVTLHRLVRAWLPTGGHCEDDPTVLDVARREATEESGIAGLDLDPHPLRIDRFAVNCQRTGPTRHYDVCYLAVAPAGSVPVRSPESLDLRWFGWDELPDGIGRGVAETVNLAVARLAVPER